MRSGDFVLPLAPGARKLIAEADLPLSVKALCVAYVAAEMCSVGALSLS